MSDDITNINWNAANSQEIIKRSLNTIAMELTDISESKKKAYIESEIRKILKEKQVLI